MEGNKLRLKDGSIVSQTFVNQNFGTGIEAISRGLFGRVQKVTQPYGNINPIEPTPGNVNLGTDFRTRDLADKSIYFPDQAQVVEILEDDGTRFGDKSGHKGYGNSVLLKLASGEMLRVSHMENLGDIQVGQTIQPGTFIGKAGQTGNTYGEHADVEYYNESGTVDKPENFKGFTQQRNFASQEQPQQINASSANNPVRVNSQGISQPQSEVLGASTSAPEPTPEISYQEKPFINNNKQILSSQQPSILESAATSAKVPEFGVSERAQANNIPFYRQALGDLADVGARAAGFKTDLGFSELFTGGKPTVNTDQSLVGDVYADDGEDLPEYKQAQSFADILNNIGQKLGLTSVNTTNSTSDLPQPGQGLKGLQSMSPTAFDSSSNTFQRPANSSMSLGTRVGEASSPINLEAAPVSGQSAQVRQNQSIQPTSQSAQLFTPANQGQSKPSGQTQNYGSSSSSQSVSRPSSQSSQSYPQQTNKSLNYTPAKPYTPAKVSTPAPKALNYTPANFTPAVKPNLSPAPVSQASAQPKPQSAPTNIFSKAVNAIKTIFKR